MLLFGRTWDTACAVRYWEFNKLNHPASADYYKDSSRKSLVQPYLIETIVSRGHLQEIKSIDYLLVLEGSIPDFTTL